MVRKKSVKTIRKEIMEDLAEMYITENVFKKIVGEGLKEYVEALPVEEDDNSEEHSSNVFELVQEKFYEKCEELTVLTVNYEKLIEIITSTPEGKEFEVSDNGHTIKGVGCEEDEFFENDITVDGKEIVAEYIGGGYIDVMNCEDQELSDFVALNDLEPDAVASYFGAEIKLEFDGVEDYARYF